MIQAAGRLTTPPPRLATMAPPGLGQPAPAAIQDQFVPSTGTAAEQPAGSGRSWAGALGLGLLVAGAAVGVMALSGCTPPPGTSIDTNGDVGVDLGNGIRIDSNGDVGVDVGNGWIIDSNGDIGRKLD